MEEIPERLLLAGSRHDCSPLQTLTVPETGQSIVGTKQFGLSNALWQPIGAFVSSVGPATPR